MLSRKSGKFIYFFDEPTRGLDLGEVSKLLEVARSLISSGHSVIMIEHNTQVLRAVDYLIEFGPGAGNLGGSILAQGTPAEMRLHAQSIIAKYL